MQTRRFRCDCSVRVLRYHGSPLTALNKYLVGGLVGGVLAGPVMGVLGGLLKRAVAAIEATCDNKA